MGEKTNPKPNTIDFGARTRKPWERNHPPNPKWENPKPADIGPETKPLPSLDIHAAVEPEAAAMLFAEIVVETEVVAIQVAGRYISNDYGVILTKDGLKSLDGEQWVFDEVVHFVHSEFSSEFHAMEDFFFVPPYVAHAPTNLQEDSNPLDILDPGNHNLLLFPVNNSEEHEQGDVGTHWSLVVLCVDRAHNTCRFVHHDSIRNMNQSAANHLVGNLKKIFPNFDSRCIEG